LRVGLAVPVTFTSSASSSFFFNTKKEKRSYFTISRQQEKHRQAVDTNKGKTNASHRSNKGKICTKAIEMNKLIYIIPLYPAFSQRVLILQDPSQSNDKAQESIL
jgi:hypothetical protein